MKTVHLIFYLCLKFLCRVRKLLLNFIWVFKSRESISWLVPLSNWPNVSQLLNSFFPIGWGIYWFSLAFFENWNELYSFLKKEMGSEKVKVHRRLVSDIRALFKNGKRFVRIFWKLKWNLKAIYVPCIRIQNVNSNC